MYRLSLQQSVIIRNPMICKEWDDEWLRDGILITQFDHDTYKPDYCSVPNKYVRTLCFNKNSCQHLLPLKPHQPLSPCLGAAPRRSSARSSLWSCMSIPLPAEGWQCPLQICHGSWTALPFASRTRPVSLRLVCLRLSRSGEEMAYAGIHKGI